MAGDRPPLPAGPDPAVGQVVGGIVGPLLAVQMALHAADDPVFADNLGAEGYEDRLCLADDRDGGRADVDAEYLRADLMLGFLERLALEHQLCVESVLAPQPPPHQPDILDPLLQRISSDLISWVDDGREAEPEPFDVVRPPPDPAVVGLTLDRI